MTLHFDAQFSTFYVESQYHEKNVPKAAGFRWDPVQRRWFTKDRAVAARLAPYAAGDLARELGETKAANAAAIAEQGEAQAREIEDSRAADADIVVPAPAGLAYLPYQLAGIKYALRRPATLIADEMGLGKTIQAIGVINADEAIKSVLIVCPATLRLNWQRELRRWLVRPLLSQICDTKRGLLANICIINYDILSRLRDKMLRRHWDLIIADECHLLKNPNAQRTRALIGSVPRKGEDTIAPVTAPRRLLLTGTPILNKPVEIFGLLHYLDPARWSSVWKFRATYCGETYDANLGYITGVANLEGLQNALRASVMVRRLKADVLKDLPAKRRQVVEIELDAESRRLVDAEITAFDQSEREMEDARVAAELAKALSDDEYRAAVDRLRYKSRAAFTELAKLRHDTAVAKIPAVSRFVREALEASPKVVVFCHHHDVANALMAEFGAGAVMVTGQTDISSRQFAVDRFQSEAACKVFVGSIKAAGVGITLTAASHVVFAELDWVPANITQAEDRCHRIGQRDAVLAQHLVLDGSLDARMAKILVEKQEISDRALDIKTDADPGESAHREADVVAAIAGSAATQSVSREKIAIAARAIAPHTVLLVHQALRLLAGVCDGGAKLDGAGFNRLDARIGHALAENASLTARQAALGMVLLRKYRGQLGENGRFLGPAA